MAQDLNSIKKPTILLLDNSTVYYEMMSVMIGDDYDLKFTTDAHEALGMLKTDKDISLIILALHIPHMSGVEFLMAAKNDPEIKDIPVIVLTSKEDNEAACLCLGAVDFIKKKPFPMKPFVIQKIEKALETKPNPKGVDLDSYINALFSEYQTVYLIDAEDYSFDSYSEDENYLSLNLKQRGPNFFDVIADTIKSSVVAEDADRLIDVLAKEQFMTAMQEKKGVTMNFRLNVNGNVLHYQLKAMLVPDETPQVIIGIANIEETTVDMEALYAFRDNKSNEALVAKSLSSDYMCIYLVHIDSNRFIEYRSIPEYSVLRLATSGENFYTFALKSFIEGVNPIDKKRVARQFTRENVLSTIEDYGAFRISFRLTFEESDEYVALKATKLVSEGSEYMVVGISNIDAQVNALNINTDE